MIPKFFDTKTTIEFADWILAELQRAVPSESISHKKKHAARAQQVDENIARRVVEFTRTTRLNVYKKARLVARVRDGMTAHGYPKAFVDSFTFELIARIEAAAKSRSG